MSDIDARGKEYSRRRALEHKYGLTPEEYATMLEEQSGCCAICYRSAATCKTNLHVDHDHETGEVRGLLCTQCNTGLGMFQDRIRLLAAAIVYLEQNGKEYQ